MGTKLSANNTATDHRMILMIGTAHGGTGGVASVISTYATHGLFLRWPIIKLDSHVMGCKWHKLVVFIGALLHFLVILIRGRVGLLHLHTCSESSFWRKTIFACIAFLFRKPVLLHIHGGKFMSFYKDSCGFLRRRLVRFIFERSTYVIALSSSWRERLLTIAPRTTVICIPNPVIAVGGQPRQLRERVVLFLGKICVEKGIFDLLESWKFVQGRVAGAHLVLAGDGDLATVRQRIGQLNLNGSVELPGWVSGNAKDRLLARTAVLVLPSYFEGVPMSLLEGFRLAIPCVASKVGGVPDMMTDGVEGRLITPGDVGELADALIETLVQEEQYATLSRAALSCFISDYSADVVIPKLERLYRKNGIKPYTAQGRTTSQRE